MQKKSKMMCVYWTHALQQYTKIVQPFRHCDLFNHCWISQESPGGRFDSIDCIRQMSAIFSWENCHLIKLPSSLVQSIECEMERVWASTSIRQKWLWEYEMCKRCALHILCCKFYCWASLNVLPNKRGLCVSIRNRVQIGLRQHFGRGKKTCF